MSIAAIKALYALLGLLREHDGQQGRFRLRITAVEFYESGEIKRIER